MATVSECREEVHAILVNNLVGNGIEANDIYKYRTARFRDDFPVHAFVTTHRLSAMPLNQGDQLPSFQYRIMIFARYNDQASELAAEDALDLLELLAIQSLAPAEASNLWESVEFLLSPERTSINVNGKNYRVAQQLIKLEIN